MKYLLSSILVLTLGFTSCEEHCPEEEFIGDLEVAEATLEWHGSYAVDGCGYILRLNEVPHKIINEDEIDPNLQGQSVPVIISFMERETQGFNCGDNFNSVSFDMVEMVSIEKK